MLRLYIDNNYPACFIENDTHLMEKVMMKLYVCCLLITFLSAIAHYSEVVLYKGAGQSVALSSNDIVAAGLPTGNMSMGTAFVFGPNNAQQQITPSDLSRSAQFGSSVSLSANGSTLAIGAPEDSTVGSVYIFTNQNGTYTELQKIIPSDAIGNAGFGSSVILSPDGTFLVIGGPYDNSNAGAIWLSQFSGTNFTSPQKLVIAKSVYFGNAITFSPDGTTLAVAAANVPNTCCGEIYIFEETGSSWSQTQTISSPAITSLGWSIDLSDGYLVAGAPLYKNNTGTVVIYDRSWKMKQQLLVTDNIGPSLFGSSVALDNNNNIIASGPSDNAAKSEGSVWVFASSKGSWKKSQKITSPAQLYLEQFGRSLSAANGTLAIGTKYYPAGGVFLYGNT
jgi:hypothetical protein